MFEVSTTGKFDSLVDSEAHPCGLRINATLQCWNVNGPVSVLAGQFMQASMRLEELCLLKLDQTILCSKGGVADPETPDGKFKSVVLASHHACAIREDDSISCWGAPHLGRLDAPPGKFTFIDRNGTCALRADSRVVCWGDMPVEFPDGTFTQFATGEGFSCGIKVDQTLGCWWQHVTPYIDIEPPHGRFRDLSVAAHHACAVRVNGEAVCWGRNSHGQTEVPT